MARILVVDDQKSALLMLRSVLEKNNHYVVTSQDPVDATEKLKSEHFDLVVTDAVMPGVSGYEFVKALRMDTRFAKLPVIMLTGKREKKDVELSLSVGVDDYLIKPVDPDILNAKIKSLLSKLTTAPTDFFSCAVSMDAKWLGDTKIVAVSELGLTITSTIHVPVGFKVKIESELFHILKIPPPTIRITACVPQETNKSLFTIHSLFVGLSEKELQPIRVWLFNERKTKAS